MERIQQSRIGAELPLEVALSRRAFCRALLGGPLLVSLGACQVEPAVAPPPPDLAQPLDLLAPPDLANAHACPFNYVYSSGRKPSAFALGMATEFLDAMVYVCRDEGGLFSVSMICSHMNNHISAIEGGKGGLYCATHHSAFTYEGKNLTGPDGEPAGSVPDLKHYGLCLDGKGNVAVAIFPAVDPNLRYRL